MDEFISFPKDIVSNEREKMAPALLTEIRAPWLGFDPSGNLQPPFVRFHNEIIKFCEFSSPSRQELRDRRSAFEDINACILETLPSAKVEIFGSHMTGIITPSSDIDIAILEVPIKDKDELGPLYELAEVIKSKKLASYCEVISNAKVPIVKLDHERTKISIDICCNNSSGLETGRIMQRFVREYPPMRHLTMVLKVFLAQRRMNDTYSGGIGSFLLCGMIVSFLQMRTRHETHVGKKLSW
jgi:non-canonical poly(A) RNA polymerase PAPD5/7